jgi:hypothetical protein
MILSANNYSEVPRAANGPCTDRTRPGATLSSSTMIR